MSLSEYKKKRNFKSTKEPDAKTKKSGEELLFVVQKHAARNLHYDFRLEFDGVLKSWAVPKGPSLNPDDKRLAIMVEDHPYSYKDFEGEIPKGNYGAGHVIVWDAGTFTSPDSENAAETYKNLKAGFSKGHLALQLNGEKLKGGFDLVKLKANEDNAWLLIKKADDFAVKTDVLKKDKSVLSDQTLEELKKSSAKSKKPQKTSSKSSSKKGSAAAFIKPMLAETVKEAFDRKDWIYEIKYDGYRTIAVLNDGNVDLFSRNENSFTALFKTMADELKVIDHGVVLDGEIVIEDSKGRADFQLLQNFRKSGKGTLKYFLFDILELDGNNTQGLPLIQRKELLKMLLSNYELKNIFYSDHIEEKGIDFLKAALQKNLEGIMAKDGNSEYRAGRRSKEWLKIKLINQEEAIIVGITETKGSRKYFGSLLLAQYHGKALKYIGNCGTGFSDSDLKELYSQFEPHFTDTSALKEKVSIIRKIQWMEPKYIAQVKFTEFTQEGNLRHPVFLGLRTDKEPAEIQANSNQATTGKESSEKLEKVPPKIESQAKKVAADAKKEVQSKKDSDRSIKIGKTTVQLTNQQKVYFPGEGITKGDLVNYYLEVAEVILPYLKDRPQSMNRFPNGITGQSFYQKNMDTDKIPSWLKTFKVFSESTEKDIDYLICNDTATLIYMANLGCIEFNPWNSTTKNPEKPDWVVIDLDPPKKKPEFKQVIDAALVVKEIMDGLEVDCFCKTSGATGLHVYIPLGAKYEYDTVRIFAQLIAQKVNDKLPKTTTLNRPLNQRKNRIYVDYLQNRQGQTLAAPYSARPKPGATVSTPLEWDEVNHTLSPSRFTIHNMLQRIEKKGDLWKPVLGKGIDMLTVIESMENKP
ncbi:DNA ligase D [Pararhodonellum marinum]|uniref:DNA ligase D n=1 Tax=Pararhodonellum marinum TaxID=2755358 RepID=UPI00188E213A|nr:DNA ligase D [Pararhodonellum marinum]